MKKVILSLLIVVFLTGCVSIQNASIDDLVDTTINSKYTLYNHVNRGFKYYLPRELSVSKSDKYNEIIRDKKRDKILKILIGLVIAITVALLVLINYRLTTNAQKNCIEAGHSENYCYERL